MLYEIKYRLILYGTSCHLNRYNNHTTTFTYDEQNQLTKTTNSLNEQKLYAYDINRNLSMIVTPKGAQIKLYNNPANMVEKKFLPDEIVDYTYDGEYNLTRATNTDSDLTFTYDSLSRLTTAQTAGIVQPATSISYTYDINSNLTAMTDPAGIITNYVYDTLNRLTDIKDVTAQIISHYDYDVLSRRIQKQFTVGSQQFAANYQYDIASQLLSITNLPTSISDSYTYDNVENRLSLTDNNGLHSYNYDNVYRLLNSTNPGESYSYDPVGNRNPLTRTYDSGNRLLDDGTYTYTYDLDGNMTSKVKKIGGDTTTYTYNSEDQLIGVNGNISYKYDALGRRIEKNAAGTITRYVYEGEDIIQELDGNNQIVATYTHGPGIDEPILVEMNSQKYYYISDGLGSITALVDQNGNIAQTYRYDSFGNIINSSGTISQPFTYTGREYDAETGLYYYRARYMDPKTGRFLQEDPVWDQNLYSYCSNDPINFKDPSGLIWVTVGYKYNGFNRLIVFRNRVTFNLVHGLKQARALSSDELVGTKRDVIQEWQPDFNNSCLDNMYPYGTKRKITQTYNVNFAGSPANQLTNDPYAELYYQWDPWVNSPTYKSFANQEISYPKDQNYIFIQQIMEGRNGR